MKPNPNPFERIAVFFQEKQPLSSIESEGSTASSESLGLMEVGWDGVEWNGWLGVDMAAETKI